MTLTLKQAVANGQIYIAFQPLVDLDSGEVFAYEALVRSRAPEFPHPAAILEEACKTRYMGQLGRILRRMAIDNCTTHPLFLNLHPDEFDEHWLVRPDDSISDHEQQVFLEITESVPLSHYVHCHSVLAEVRQRGIKIAVDDLGAGYSNLKYIADLEPEIVKLDRELIIDLVINTPLHRLVSSIVDLCRALGAKVVAEGIETLDELKAVIDTGAHYGQGYLLARPTAALQDVDFKGILSARPDSKR